MMNPLSLPPDDRAPSYMTLLDRLLHQQLENCMSKYFYEACDRPLQILLSTCQWSVIANTHSITLVIECPDLIVNWLILRNVLEFGSRLEQFSSSAKIRIYPPPNTGTPFEMRVDEISIYRGFL